MRQTPILSNLELRLLGLIRDVPRNGYALRKELDGSPGAIYPALRRLASAGLIEGRTEATGGRQKETFAITATGRRALREGLDRPTIEEVRRDPEAVAARLQFLSGAAAAAFLDEFARLSTACAADRKGEEGLAAEYEAAMYAARARWAAATAKKIRGRGV